MSRIKRSHRVAHQAEPGRCRQGVRENFLYVFKAARRAARAADAAAARHSRHGSHAGRPPTPVGWRENPRPHGRHGRIWVLDVQAVNCLAGSGSYREHGCSRTWNCPARSEPVKGAYGVPTGRPLTEPARESRRSQLSGATRDQAAADL